jgi:hypothetical protein
LETSVLLAAAARAHADTDSEGLSDTMPGWQHSIAQSSEAPRAQVVHAVNPLTGEYASEHASWVLEAKTSAEVEFEEAAIALASEGKPSMGDRMQQLRLRLCAADSAEEAAEVYKSLAGEWLLVEGDGGHLDRGKRLFRCVLGVLVRLSRTRIGLVDRDGFDGYMWQLFGDWLIADRSLFSRIHSAFQKSVKELPGDQEAFISNTAVGNMARSGNMKPRRARYATLAQAEQLQQLQQQEPTQLQQLQQQEAETVIVPPSTPVEAFVIDPPVTPAEPTWQRLGDDMPPPSRR